MTVSIDPTGSPPARQRLTGVTRTIAVAALSAGLLVVGGTAMVLAADPSASPAPAATTQPPSGGSTAPNGAGPRGLDHANGRDCPNKDGSGSGNGPSSTTAPSTNAPSSGA